MAGKTKPASTMVQDILAVKKQEEARQKQRKRLRQAPGRRDKIRTGVVIALFGLLVYLVIAGDQNAVAEKYAQIATLVSPVDLFQATSSQKGTAAVHETVVPGDILTTGAAASAHVEFPDQTLVKIGPNTAFNIHYNVYSRLDAARRRGLFVNAGRIWARVTRFVSGTSEFTVETPTALAAVRGTRFSVLVQNGVTSLSVYDGQVHVNVKNALTPAITVGPGQELTILPNATSTPVPMTQAEMQEWQAQKDDILADPPDALQRWLVDMEEHWIVRPIAHVAALFHIDRLSGRDENGNEISATTAYAQAHEAALEIQSVMKNSYEGASAFPQNVSPDLSNINTDKNTIEAILKKIDGGRILHYARPEEDTYVIDIRAKFPSGALIQITPSAIKALEDDNP